MNIRVVRRISAILDDLCDRQLKARRSWGGRLSSYKIKFLTSSPLVLPFASPALRLVYGVNICTSVIKSDSLVQSGCRFRIRENPGEEDETARYIGRSPSKLRRLLRNLRFFVQSIFPPKIKYRAEFLRLFFPLLSLFQSFEQSCNTHRWQKR